MRLRGWNRKRHFGLRVADWPRVEIYGVESICQHLGLVDAARLHGAHVLPRGNEDRRGVPDVVRTATSFQKRFFIAVPGFMCDVRRSWPLLISSACRRRRSTRSPYCEDGGRGAVGGGPGWVDGRGVADSDGEAWRHLRFRVAIDREEHIRGKADEGAAAMQFMVDAASSR